MKSIDVDGESKTAVVEMEPGRVLTAEDCDEAFESTRYSVQTFVALTPGT